MKLFDDSDLDKKENVGTEKDILLVEVLLRVSAVENVLMKKGILTEQELNDELLVVRERVMELIKNNSSVIASIELKPITNETPKPDRSKN